MAEPLADADLDTLNLAEYLKDEDKIQVPKKGEVEFNNKETIEKPSPKESMVNINKGSQTDLETIPGVGPQTAKRIIEHRKTNGIFKTVEGLLDVSGIGEKTLEKIKPYITL